MINLAIEIGNKSIELDAFKILMDKLKKKNVLFSFVNIQQNTSLHIKHALNFLKTKNVIFSNQDIYRYNRERNENIILFLMSEIKDKDYVLGNTFISFNKPFIEYISNSNTISKNDNMLDDIMDELSDFIIYLDNCRNQVYGENGCDQFFLFDMSHRLLMQKYMKLKGIKLGKKEFNCCLDTIVTTYGCVDKQLTKENYIIVSGFDVKTKNHRRFKVSDMKKSFVEVFGKDNGK